VEAEFVEKDINKFIMEKLGGIDEWMWSAGGGRRC
jgi:hypothetical protein